MTDKGLSPELVAAIRDATARKTCDSRGNIVGSYCPLNDAEIIAALSAALPILREQVLRELRWYKVRTGPSSFKMFGQHGNEMLEAYATEHGLDLDGES